MSALVAPKDVDKLAAIVGLLTSDHAGEQAAAADKATQILRSYGLTWRQLIERAFAVVEEQHQHRPSDLRVIVAECLRSSRLTDWERRFLVGIGDLYLDELSEKQVRVLDGIHDKVRS